MAPPQLSIDTKRSELKLQPDNDENNGCADTGAEKTDSDVANPTGNEESNGEKEKRNEKLRPALILVFFGLVVAFVGVSFNRSNVIMKLHLCDFLFSPGLPGLSVEG